MALCFAEFLFSSALLFKDNIRLYILQEEDELFNIILHAFIIQFYSLYLHRKSFENGLF